MTVINFFRKRLDVIIILSLFNFVFLGSEYLFDNNAARVTSETGVVTAQSYILAASVVGFLLFSFVEPLESELFLALAVVLLPDLAVV